MEKKQILIIDDDIDIINIVSTVLEIEGYNMLQATSVKEAEKILEQKRPDLILLDVMMDKVYEGFEFAKKLKTDEKLKTIPVLIHTSMDVFESDNAEDIAMARQYRSQMKDGEMDVLFVRNTATKEAGIDYKDENGKINWIPVEGFVSKAMKTEDLLFEIERVLRKAKK